MLLLAVAVCFEQAAVCIRQRLQVEHDQVARQTNNGTLN